MNFASLEFITLENFQSLKKRTEIPIKPLTFLYGPNSSGKSAIYDALTFIDSFLRDSEEELQNYINRWAYKSKGNTLIDKSEGLHMIVEARFSIYPNRKLLTDSDFGDYEATPSEYGNFGSSINSFDLRIEINDIDIFFTASIDGKKLIEIVPAGGFDDHSLLIIHTKTFDRDIVKLADRHEIKLDNKKNVEVTCRILREKGINLVSTLFNASSVESYNFNRDLISIGNHILECFKDIKFSPSIVSADRTTIQNEELSCVLSIGQDSGHIQVAEKTIPTNWWPHHPCVGLPINYIQSPTESQQRVQNLSSGFMLEIAISRFAVEMKRKNIGIKEWKVNEIEKDEALVDYVNRCLADHLFLDQGYQIVHEICEILPPVPFNQTHFFAALLICSLMDKSGRRITFEDVGTGISCIIPILVTLYSSASFIQQPELHLHPALQSAFGDILVETTKEKKGYKHFIETHSEYILLRCLRRIRETTNEKHSAQSPIALTPDDISVLYFCPQADGSTEVKKLRVSSQGDFIDRWPRGFFEERGKELFDE